MSTIVYYHPDDGSESPEINEDPAQAVLEHMFEQLQDGHWPDAPPTLGDVPEFALGIRRMTWEEFEPLNRLVELCKNLVSEALDDALELEEEAKLPDWCVSAIGFVLRGAYEAGPGKWACAPRKMLTMQERNEIVAALAKEWEAAE